MENLFFRVFERRGGFGGDSKMIAAFSDLNTAKEFCATQAYRAFKGDIYQIYGSDDYELPAIATYSGKNAR